MFAYDRREIFDGNLFKPSPDKFKNSAVISKAHCDLAREEDFSLRSK
ncbi:hypothetical protein Mucpa_3009 [Mucilaginibacter paludis DSM 18603]|uniref:Uncharacterized protein n=1 Tax=Mucilaginibacter paludis DSM 18603 TaxID=714943 RepID=H1YD90_9SPHI|nr:hypothetical protein Mucpa_3009 [Mucilaginibacter paludis DSM 18603]